MGTYVALSSGFLAALDSDQYRPCCLGMRPERAVRGDRRAIRQWWRTFSLRLGPEPVPL